MMGLAVLHGAESENAWPVELCANICAHWLCPPHANLCFSLTNLTAVTDGYEITKAHLGRPPRATTRAPLCRAQSFD